MGQDSSTQRRQSAENPPVNPSDPEVGQTSPLQIYHNFEDIVHPNLDQLRDAAYRWDHIAKHSTLKYAFVGSFVALLSGARYDIESLDILVEPSAMENSKQRLTQIWQSNMDYLQFSTSNRAIIVIRENTGVAV